MGIYLLYCVFFVPICSFSHQAIQFSVVDGVSGQCLADERDLLLQLKSSLRVDVNAAKKLVRWDQNSDCCSWDGVSCDAAGRVTGLNLSGESISGGLDNSTLFNLEHLERLDLSYNKLNSSVPARIGNLSNLTRLNLSNAGFGGQIPKEVMQLTGLVALDISPSGLWQISSLKLENPNLSMLIQNLSKLEELYLDGVNISANGNEWGQALSSSLPRLRVLSLTNCHLSGPIDTSLRELRSLSVIRLDNNDLSSTVPELFSSFSNLTSLRLSSCKLYGIFPGKIFQVQTLQVIDISDNPSLQGSLPEFNKTSVLQTLVLTSTNFSGSLPSSIGNLQNLSVLDLSHCQFSGILPDSMAQLSRLVSVDLSNNMFGGPIPTFRNSKNLKEVVLSYNSLTGSITSAHWEGLNKLNTIELRNNLLNGSVPSSMFELPSLEQVRLSNNRFEGQLPEFQRASSSLLETIDLSSNNFGGSIPTSIFGHRKLNVLSLSSNNLSGTVELDHIQGIHNLTTLDLSYNSLSVIGGDNGSSWSSFSKLNALKLASCKLKNFPNLKNHPRLVNLDLSNNQIQGELPNWIWELGNGFLYHLNLSCNSLVSLQEPYTLPSFLHFLDLHMNQINGNIPSLRNFTSYVDLSYNNFNSSIPSDIVNPSAIFLSLSNNNLTGAVPESICNASGIQVLDLSYNRLRGNIPACMPAMSRTLVVLDLQRNHFTGQIPDSFPESCRLRTLNLNGNSIERQIPQSLVNCRELEVLNLGNNKLYDKFPCTLKNISTLRVLVLRSNNFSGNIGCHNSSVTWQMLQILDLAHNNFSGKIPEDCLKRWEAMHDDENDSISKSHHIQFEILQFSDLYYRDAVTITSKGLELEFVKILTVFTAIDLSCNKLVGQVPKDVGYLTALYVLNLSRNALTGQIPPSIGNLSQLESLDLSWNNLSGSIPASLASLNFLSFLNLSFNNLTGKIPSGSQIQTFSADSFSGNPGLCGFPLTENCDDEANGQKQNSSPGEEQGFWSDVNVDWQSIHTGVGFGVGAGAAIALLMLWHEGTYWLEDNIDKILRAALPIFGFSYKPRDEWDDGDDNNSEEEEEEDHRRDIEMEDIRSPGRFCVFCSKLDVATKKAVHDPRCSCFSSPAVSSSSFYSSSYSSVQ